MSKGQQLKQRKKGNKKEKEPSPTEKKKDDAATEESEKESLLQTFLRHPLVVVAPWILGPYFLYLAYFYVRLQRPDFLIPFGINLRPAVAIDEPRQVLIVGSMSSGTVQVAYDMVGKLELEIGHESSNSVNEFVRDGTVSWFHVIRYIEPLTDKEQIMAALKNLCLEWTGQMGFHPAMYKPSDCSDRVKWDSCWSKQCLDVLQREWGCGLTKSCETPFQATIHQRRHPLRTIESLVVKFCQGNELEAGVVSPAFAQFATGLFGHKHNFTNDSCVEVAAHYVLEYNTVLLDAQLNFHLDGFYAIESTSVCEIARLAGFVDPKKVVYSPNVEKVAKICSLTNDHPAQQPIKSTEHKRNDNVVQLSWEDLRGGKHGSKRPADDTSLEQAIRDLTLQLGYEVV